jgi:VWFA-related protein
MRKILTIALILVSLSTEALPQSPQKPGEGHSIRISAELVQLDVVVTDKEGRLVTNLTKKDFTLLEKGKKQQVNFFEYVAVGASRRQPEGLADKPVEQTSGQELLVADLKRVFAFVVDDLTIGYNDLAYIRQTLAQFVDKRMGPGDLVAIVRTAGGKGLLQQFTSNKELLHRAIDSLTPRPDALGQADGSPSTPTVRLNNEIPGEAVNNDGSYDDYRESLRPYMTLSTAGFVIDSMKELPGRKALVLVSGGLPILTTKPQDVVSDALYFLNRLADEATRAGVVIHTLDVRGLNTGFSTPTPNQNVNLGPTVLANNTGAAGTASNKAATGVASNRSGGIIGAGADTVSGRPDVGINSRSSDIFFSSGRFNDFGYIDPISAQQGLRMLSSATGGIPVLNKNDFDEGLGRIAGLSEGYYLLAYTPSDTKFDNKFRNVEIKVNRPDAKVYYRRGYFAHGDQPAAAAVIKPEQILAAIRSPLARRDIDVDAMLLFDTPLHK